MMFSSSEAHPHVFGPLTLSNNEPASSSRSGDPSAPAPPAPDPRAIASAWDDAYQRGYEEGLRIALEEQQATAARLAEVAGNALLDATDLIRQCEQQVVELSLAVAEKVIEREARIDRTLVLSVVRAALEELQEAATVVVRVHPDDHASLLPRWRELERKPLVERWELIPDERVQPGGCLVETEIEHLDGQLSTKLAQIVNSFHAVLEGEPQ